MNMRMTVSALAVVLCEFAAASTFAATPDAVPLQSRVTGVTVYADRARVTRRAPIRLQQGLTTFALARLPGWIDEESLRVAVTPPQAGRLADVRLEREYLSRAREDEVTKAELAVREIADKVAETDDELRILEAQKTQVEAIKAFSIDKMPRDIALGAVGVETYGKTVAFVADTLRQIATRRRELERQRRDVQPELNARQKKLDEVRKLTQLEQCTVRVLIDGAAAAEATLDITYMLPGATWEAAHELRAEGLSPKTVSLASYALLSQTTGEDWDGAEIVFSTQSLSETIRIPELEALRLGGARPVQRTPAGQTSSFSKAAELHALQNGYWYNLNNPKDDFQAYQAGNTRMFNTRDRISELFRQIQDRGTTAHFKGAGLPTVRADGRVVRIPIGAAELESVPRIVAAPEVSLNAARIVELRNRGNSPLLPGAVALYHSGAFLGSTALDFVAEGEPFAVVLGVADHVKLTRALDRKRSSLVRGQRTRIQVSFDVQVENLSDAESPVRLLDRVPVSEEKDIRIFDVEIEPSGKPDSKGLLQWDLVLKPREKKAFRIEYTLEYPSAVRLQRARRDQVEGEQGMPAAAAPQSDLMMQIDSLEKKF